jgi:uncharacterized protein (DUF952 family)
MAIIFRISEREQWKQAQEDGFYTDESLNNDGYIHMSERHQVIEVANYLYKGQKDLMMLAVDTDKLTSKVRYEKLGTDEPFPYIYGVINADAVIAVADFSPNADGLFKLPEEFSS